MRFSFFEAVEKSVRYIIRAMNLMMIRDFDEQSIDVAFCPIGWLCKFISIIAPCHKKVLTAIARQWAGGAGWCALVGGF